jgi:hypothetical protein
MAAEFLAASGLTSGQVRQMALDSRLFTARAAAWAADNGISQFIDLGAGLPPGSLVHEMARSLRPAARTVYVDDDAEVTDYLRDVALDGGQEGVAVVTADLADPAKVLADPELLEVTGLAAPACLIFGLSLHFRSPAAARAIVAGYAARVAPGSLIAVSVPRIADDLAWKRLAAAYPAEVHNFSAGELGDLFGGLELVPPGIGPAGKLRPGWGDVWGWKDAGPAYVLAGIGRKR